MDPAVMNAVQFARPLAGHNAWAMTAPPTRLRLRPTMLSDLDYVVGVEVDAHNLPFITPWERMQHEGAGAIPGLPTFHRRSRG
jgi:hypothetical protein